MFPLDEEMESAYTVPRRTSKMLFFSWNRSNIRIGHAGVLLLGTAGMCISEFLICRKKGVYDVNTFTALTVVALVSHGYDLDDFARRFSLWFDDMGSLEPAIVLLGLSLY